jgi:hypothetical protein
MTPTWPYPCFALVLDTPIVQALNKAANVSEKKVEPPSLAFEKRRESGFLLYDMPEEVSSSGFDMQRHYRLRGHRTYGYDVMVEYLTTR